MTVLLDIEVLGAERPQAERAARQDMRAQIARLEARGVTTPAASSGPRILSLGELEALRDAMLGQTCSSPTQGPVNCTLDEARLRLERMVADPASHRHESVSLAELGLPGCGTYRVKPRLGLVGMLAGWWEITLSSGCP
jgi:hypothetical protein